MPSFPRRIPRRDIFLHHCGRCGALGFSVNPHRFRLAAATLWSSRDSSERARCQGPARSRIIQYDGKALHYGAVACRGPCTCSCHRKQTKKGSSLSHNSALLSVNLRRTLAPAPMGPSTIGAVDRRLIVTPACRSKALPVRRAPPLAKGLAK
jgi:hypothetical protein